MALSVFLTAECESAARRTRTRMGACVERFVPSIVETRAMRTSFSVDVSQPHVSAAPHRAPKALGLCFCAGVDTVFPARSIPALRYADGDLDLSTSDIDIDIGVDESAVDPGTRSLPRLDRGRSAA